MAEIRVLKKTARFLEIVHVALRERQDSRTATVLLLFFLICISGRIQHLLPERETLERPGLGRKIILVFHIYALR